MAKAVRMSDIAERLHVSIVTVSKALAGKDGVSEELRQEILQLAEEMGYQSKKFKPAATGKTYTLGIVTSYRYIEKGQSFYWNLYERILFYLAQTGHIGILEVVTDSAEQERQIPRLVQEERVDGVIVMGNFSKSYREMLAETGIPLVVLDAFDARYHRDSVISDGYYGMYTMVDYLLQMGHRNIMFVGSVNATSSITDRYYGYCRAMREAGVSVTEDYVLPDRDAEGKVTISLEHLKKMPSAFACNCDITAYTLLNALKEQGVRVPEDVSVVGFDDYILAGLAVPPLTTYAVDVDHMAKVSAQQLIRRIQKPDADVRRIVVSGKLVITFREIQYDLNKNNQFDGGNDWMAGDWVAWVGTYEDLMEQNDGQCHILLCEDWANNRYSGDTGYTGMVVLPDGTFVMDSYGHWDKEFSQSWQGSDGSGYNVKTDLCYIKQAKFKLADVIGESIVAVKDVMLNPSEVKLTEKGQTVQLTATVAPENATNKQVNFSIDHEEVATVDAEGKVTAKADGTAVVAVTTVDGNKTATCSVTVEIPKDPTPDPDPKPEPNPTPNPTPTPDPTPTPTPSVPDKQEPTPDSTMTVGSEQKTGKGVYRITGTGSKRTVTFVKPINDKNTSFNVPASVKLADGRYKVTAIDKNAFKNNKKLKKVTIGSKVTRIGAGAFSGAKNLKAITIKSKSLKSVGKNALKGIHKKCTIKVPKTKLTAYKRLLKKKGQKASVKIIK